MEILSRTELESISGGSELSEAVFRLGGYIWQKVKYVYDVLCQTEPGTHIRGF